MVIGRAFEHASLTHQSVTIYSHGPVYIYASAAISGAARPDSVPFFDDLCAK
jgi:hypothetical protein